MTNEVDDAGLHDGLGEHGRNGLGEAFEAVDDGNQNISDATVLELIHDPEPEFGAFSLFDPDAQFLFAAIGQYGECNLDSLVPDKAFVPVNSGDKLCQMAG